IHPAVDQLLQTGLAAKVFGSSVVRQHVFPGIDFEHLASRSIIVRTVRLAPGQPPMIDAAFLLSANIAIERLRPGHSAPRSETVAQVNDGKQLPCCTRGNFLRGKRAFPAESLSDPLRRAAFFELILSLLRTKY